MQAGTELDPDVVRRLVLLRHAKAEPGGQKTDELRPLALAGRRQSQRVGVALAEQGLIPDLVLCSSAIRARQTWELVRSGLGSAEPELLVSEMLYEAGTVGVLAQVREVADDVRTVLVVGHEPIMSAVAGGLAGEGSDAAAIARLHVGMSTATFAVLEFVGSWMELDSGGARLVAVVVPVG